MGGLVSKRYKYVVLIANLSPLKGKPNAIDTKTYIYKNGFNKKKKKVDLPRKPPS